MFVYKFLDGSSRFLIDGCYTKNIEPRKAGVDNGFDKQVHTQVLESNISFSFVIGDGGNI